MVSPSRSSHATTLDPIGPVRTGCLCCPPRAGRLNLNWNHHPGFGITYLKRDGETVWSDVHGTSKSYGRAVELEAAKDPDHDWQFEIHGPMGGVVYQRHGEKTWHTVKRLDGFA